MFYCSSVAVNDFDGVFKRMFRSRGETRRIDKAVQIARAAYVSMGLDADFDAAIAAMRHCLSIRNQYAHWTFWDDNSGELAFANVEDLAKVSTPVTDLMALGVFHINAALVQEQEAFFVYVDHYLSWVNYEGRFKAGKINRGLQKPATLAFPALRL